MSKGDKSEQSEIIEWIIPLIGICLAMLIAWGIGYLQAKETYNHKQQVTAYEQAAQDDTARSCIGTDPVIVFKCVNDRTKAAYETQHDQEDLAAQQRAASSALLTAISGFLTLLAAIAAAFYARNAAVHTERSADIAGKALDETDRPYMLLTILRINFKEPNIDGSYPFEYRFTNHGKGPAWIKAFGIETNFITQEQVFSPENNDWQIKLKNWPIPPGNWYGSTEPGSITLDTAKVSATLEGSVICYAVCHLAYSDDRKRIHELTTVQTYRLSDGIFEPVEHPLNKYT